LYGRGKSCGICRFCSDGGFANNAILPKESLIPIPDDLDTHVACFAEPVGCVINAFEKLSFKKNERVLIYGAGTMGLITALYARDLGLTPLIIEKSEDKIKHINHFLQTAGIGCTKKTHKSEFDLVINACADFIAFSQSIVKVGKGGQISFFSGISKNEQIETNLLNLIHYKEAKMSGVYGMTRDHMKKSIPFMQAHEHKLRLLIEKITAPQLAPEMMAKVLSGKYLKFILDFNLAEETLEFDTIQKKSASGINLNDLDSQSLCRQIIEAVVPLPDNLLAAATTKIDEKTKPLGALGRLEELAVQMSLLQNSLNPEIRQKSLFVFAGDHGITEEGVSAYPSEVTAQMVDNFLNGGAAIKLL